MRLGELLALQWGDLDFTGRFIHVRRNRVGGKLTSTKNRQRRQVDMSQQLTVTLRRLRTDRKRAALAAGKALSPWVFLTARDRQVDGDNLRNRVFYRLLDLAEVREIRFHDLVSRTPAC
jgi:integrase